MGQRGDVEVLTELDAVLLEQIELVLFFTMTSVIPDSGNLFVPLQDSVCVGKP